MADHVLLQMFHVAYFSLQELIVREVLIVGVVVRVNVCMLVFVYAVVHAHLVLVFVGDGTISVLG